MVRLAPVDRSERLTLAVFATYLVTLGVVLVVDEPAVWLAWSVAAVVLTGGTLVAVDRSSDPG